MENGDGDEVASGEWRVVSGGGEAGAVPELGCLLPQALVAARQRGT